MSDYAPAQQDPELDQVRRSLRARAATVRTRQILGVSAMQDADSTWSGGDNTVTNKVCAVTLSRVLYCLPSPTPVGQINYTPTVIPIPMHLGLESLAHCSL